MGNVTGMPRPRLPYLHRETTRHGKTVWYYRRTLQSPRIRIPGAYGEPEFLAAYDAATRGETAPRATAAPQKGTFAWLVTQWQASVDWAAMRPATQRQRRNILSRMIAENRTEPYAVTQAMIKKGMERRAATPAAADNFLKTMKALYRWAKDAGHMATDPTEGVKLRAEKTDGHKPWTPEIIARYESVWGPETRERVWLHVMLYTGLRIGDAYRVGAQHCRDGWLKIRTEKTGAHASMPLLPQLEETLATGPTADMAFCCSTTGEPFQTKEGFANAFRKACRKAAIVGYSPHGLRKALATMMASAGASELQLQAWFTWTDNRTSSVYTKKADRERLAASAADLFNRAISGTPISAPQKKVRKTGKIEQ